MASSLSWWYALPVLAGLVVLALSVAGLSGALEAQDRGLSLRAGLTTPLRESARLLHQRPRRTVSADRLLWRAASSAVVPLAVLIVAFVPLGAHALVDHPLGVVWINALDVVAWAVMWLLGWGANSVMGLVGGYRFLALALAYELPLMFALTAPAIAAGKPGPGGDRCGPGRPVVRGVGAGGVRGVLLGSAGLLGATADGSGRRHRPQRRDPGGAGRR